MIVVIGGMIRSGSTFSFNIVRELLDREGEVEFASDNSIEDSTLEHSSKKSFILKTHNPDFNVLKLIKEGVLPCICTIRSPEDAILSWMRAFNFPLEHGIAQLKSWFSWYTTVANNVLTIDYEIIENQPRLAIQLIIDYIGMKRDEVLIDMLEKEYDKLSIKTKFDDLTNNENTVDIGFSYYDKETLFHRQHITSLNPKLAQIELEPSQIHMIRSELREFLP